MEVNELISCLDNKLNHRKDCNLLSSEEISNGLAQAIVSGDESSKNLAIRAAAELTTRIDESMKPVLLMLEELDAPLEAVLDNIDDALKRGAVENIIRHCYSNNNNDDIDEESRLFMEKTISEDGLIMSCKPMDLSFTFERMINRQLAFPCGLVDIIYDDTFELEPEYLLFIETNGEIALQIGPGILQHIEFYKKLWNNCIQASARSHSPCAMLAISPLTRELLKQSKSFICQSRWAPPWERYGPYGSSALLTTHCSWKNLSIYLNATEKALNYAFTPTHTPATIPMTSTASTNNTTLFRNSKSEALLGEELLKRRLDFMLLFVGYGSWLHATLIVAVLATNNSNSNGNQNDCRLVSSEVEACSLRVLRRVLHDGGMTVSGTTQSLAPPLLNSEKNVIGEDGVIGREVDVDAHMFTDLLDNLVTNAKEGSIENFHITWMKAGKLGIHCLLLLMLATRVLLASVTLDDFNDPYNTNKTNSSNNNTDDTDDTIKKSRQIACVKALEDYSCVCMRAARLEMAEHITTRCHLTVHVTTAWLLDIARQLKTDSDCELNHLISLIHISIWDTMVEQISVDSWFYMLLSFLGTDVKQELKKFEDTAQQEIPIISFCNNSNEDLTS